VWVRRGYAVLSDSAASPAQLAAAFADVAAPVEAALAASGGPFLLSGSLSLADAAFAPFTERYALAFRELRGWDLLAARPALAAWQAAVEALPSFAASQAPRDELLALYSGHSEPLHRSGTAGDAPAQLRRSSTTRLYPCSYSKPAQTQGRRAKVRRGFRAHAPAAGHRGRRGPGEPGGGACLGCRSARPPG
jgi:hypothetical protein